MPEPRSTDRLDSWKEIAAHLSRDVTTVQRWEKREGMPVHRHLHDRLGSVYAYGSELDAWWEQRTSLKGNGSPAIASRGEPVETSIDAVVSSLRQRMLMAQSASDLQRLDYEISELLSRRPGLVDALVLRDDIRGAIQRERFSIEGAHRFAGERWIEELPQSDGDPMRLGVPIAVVVCLLTLLWLLFLAA